MAEVALNIDVLMSSRLYLALDVLFPSDMSLLFHFVFVSSRFWQFLNKLIVGHVSLFTVIHCFFLFDDSTHHVHADWRLLLVVGIWAGSSFLLQSLVLSLSLVVLKKLVSCWPLVWLRALLCQIKFWFVLSWSNSRFDRRDGFGQDLLMFQRWFFESNFSKIL